MKDRFFKEFVWNHPFEPSKDIEAMLDLLVPCDLDFLFVGEEDVRTLFLCSANDLSVKRLKVRLRLEETLQYRRSVF